jgi:hypothetical protein
MVFITAVHMEGGYGHEHIASVRWRNPATSKTGESTRGEMVDFINQNDAGVAKVTDGVHTVNVGVFKEKWLRTYADRTWTDNLLALPKF